MKKILLTTGTLVSVVAPVATVVACGSDDTNNNGAGTQVAVDSVKANAAITAFVGATGHTSPDLTDLTTADLETSVTKSDHYTFQSHGETKTGVSVTFTLKVDKTTAKYWFAGVQQSGAIAAEAGAKINLIIELNNDAEWGDAFVEWSNSDGSQLSPVADPYKTTLENVLKAAGFVKKS